jgi:hypothetical protein
MVFGCWLSNIHYVDCTRYHTTLYGPSNALSFREDSALDGPKETLTKKNGGTLITLRILNI